MSSNYNTNETAPLGQQTSVSHSSNTAQALDPRTGTGSHLPTSTHGNNTHSSNPLSSSHNNETYGTGHSSSGLTGDHHSSGLTGQHAGQGGALSGNGSGLTGDTLYNKKHENDQSNTQRLTSTGLPGHEALNNDSHRPGHGLDTEQIEGHHSRRDPNHDSSVAGSAGSHGLSLEDSRAHASAPGPTYPDLSSGSNPAHGTGRGPSHGNPGVHSGPDATHSSSTTGAAHKVSIGDKVKGSVDVLVGKATHNPAKVAEGEALKTGSAHGATTGTTGSHTNTAGTNNHSTVPHNATGAGAHGLSTDPGHPTTKTHGHNDNETYHDKEEGFAKEHIASTGHSGNVLTGSGTGL